jgi:hypothetical protein
VGLISEAPAKERATYYEEELRHALGRVRSENGQAPVALKIDLLQTALDAGTVAIELAAEAALLELGRKVLHLTLANRLKEGGMSETKSLEAARAEPTYVQYGQDLIEVRKAQQPAELVRDVALAVGRAE